MATQNKNAESGENLRPADSQDAAVPSGPAALLREQAALLADETRGLVTAEVRGDQDPRSGLFAANFYLVGPKINFRYLLFTLSFPREFYPASLAFEPWTPAQIQVADETELKSQLQKIFADESTRRVIGVIKARSK